MAFFRRNKQSTTSIPELQEYYASQKNDSTGKAWLLAIGSLLVTIVVLVGAFYGGRWLYRKATNNDKPKTAATSQNESAGKSVVKNSTTPDKPAATTKPATPATPSPSNTPAPTPAPKPAQGVAPTQSAATNTAATAASTPTKIADAGPGNTISLFIAIMTVSYVLHRAYTVRSLKK